MKNTEKKAELLSFAGNYKWLTIIGCILSGISAILSLAPFIYIWLIVSEIFKVLPDINKAQNLPYYGWMTVLFSVLSILIYCIGLLCTHISAFRIARNMRSKALHHIVKLPLGYFNEQGSGKLRRIIDESSGQTETFLAHQLPDLTGAYVTPASMIILLFIFDWRLGLISIAPIVIGFFILMKMTGSSMKSSIAQYQNSLEDMNNEAVEYVRGIPVVKAFQQSVFSFKKFHDAIMRYKKFVLNYTISCRVPMIGFTVCINAVFALLVPAGILLIASAINYKAFLLNFIFYVLFTPVVTVMMSRILYSSENNMIAQDAAKRIYSILNEKPLKETSLTAKPKDSSITFENVTFSYNENDTPAVNNISFNVPSGSKIALVGPSGGGKSTIASLIPRFWDVDSGKVMIGSVDVRNISTSDLMDNISFVFQQTKLFKTSIFENIRFSKPNASAEDVIKAAKAAQCEEIFEKLPLGMDTVVGTKGVFLSGGEIQRIALARAILKDSPIILLDEATAFSDPENEYKIQLAFEKLTKGKTVIMIAHRLSTVKNADIIYVIDQGKIVEQGSHSQLLDKKGTYSKMWKNYKSSITWKVENPSKLKKSKVSCND